MSRIGKMPVSIPQGVEVRVQDGVVVVKGRNGELREPLPPAVSAVVDGGAVRLTVDKGARKDASAIYGMARARVQNLVLGVSQGFSKTLEIVGLGFRAEAAGNKLTMTLGKSHPVIYEVPKGLKVETDAKKTQITLSGSNKDLLGETAAKIRGLREPEPYKGTGIRYKGEAIRKKAGKTAAGASAGAGGGAKK